MIKEIFLPEKMGNKRILAQRIIGLSLHEDSINAAIVHAKRSKTLIEHLLTQKIEPEQASTYADRAAHAIKQLVSKIKGYDQIRINIPASLVVFKELQVQFIDPEKIRLVLDYEIEAMLPFSIQDAVLDFIITKINPDHQSAQLLVAAVRSQDLQEQLSLYSKAGIDPTSVTIDLFALYGLYQQIPEYHALPHATALIELGDQATRIIFMQNGELKLMRSINRGISSVTKFISDELNIPQNEIHKKLTTSGVKNGDELFARAAQKHFILLLNDIQFTLNSFSLKLNYYEAVTKILFVDASLHIADFMTFCSDTLQIPCEIFDCKKLLENKGIKNKIKEPVDRWNDFALALGTAMPSAQQADFDLRRKQFAYHRYGLIFKQFITACVIVIGILTTIGIRGYLDISKLNAQIQKIENTQIQRIKKENIFPSNEFPKKPILRNVIKEAERRVQEKKDQWSSFFQKRMQPIGILLELTSIIDKKNFDISIGRVSIASAQERLGGREKEEGTSPIIEVEGLFRSKAGNHFVEIIDVENRFKESNTLKVIGEIDTHPSPDNNGAEFTVKMKLKED